MSETTSIRDQRLRKGLTLRTLADACAAGGASVHYSQLARIEKGLHSPHPPLKAVLARVLDLDIEDLERKASADGASEQQAAPAKTGPTTKAQATKGRKQVAAGTAVR